MTPLEINKRIAEIIGVETITLSTESGIEHCHLVDGCFTSVFDPLHDARITFPLMVQFLVLSESINGKMRFVLPFKDKNNNMIYKRFMRDNELEAICMAIIYKFDYLESQNNE